MRMVWFGFDVTQDPDRRVPRMWSRHRLRRHEGRVETRPEVSAGRDPGGENDPDVTRESVMYPLDFCAPTLADEPANAYNVEKTEPKYGVPYKGGRSGYAIDD